MESKFLELKDGVIVEVGDPNSTRAEMHSKDHVDSTMKMVTDLLEKVFLPLRAAFEVIQDSPDKQMQIRQAEVEIGIGFSAEGNLFVTKATAEGSLRVKATFERPSKAG